MNARGRWPRSTLVVLDRSEPLTADDERLLDATAGKRRLVVGNKSDLATGRLNPDPARGDGSLRPS